MLDSWTMHQNLYGHNKSGSEESMEDVKHTEDTLQTKLKQLKADKEVLEKRRNRVIGHIKSIRPLGFPVLSDSDANKFVLNLYESWAKYKVHLYEYWYKEDKVNRSMKNPDSDGWLFTCVYIGIIVAVAVYSFKNNIAFGSTLILIAKSLIVYDIVVGIISTLYYIVRPNAINKRNFKKELKNINIELKTVETNLKTTEGLIQAKELASLKPEQEFTRVKLNNYESLVSILDFTKESVIPKLDSRVAEIYKSIIDKAYKLLELGKENGKLITEVSKIYNIYINDINNILLNKTSANDKIIETLHNFEAYLDRKIEKFSGIEDMLVESELNALNKIFTGEEE